MVGNIRAKFHGHSTSRSKVIKRGCLRPPLCPHQPKKLGINRVKVWTSEKRKIADFELFETVKELFGLTNS